MKPPRTRRASALRYVVIAVPLIAMAAFVSRSLQSDAYLGSTQQVAIHPGAGTPGAKLSGSQRPKAPRDAAAAPRGGGGGSKKPRKGRRKDSKEPPLPKEGADTKLEEVRSPRPAASAQDQAAVVDDDYVDTSAAAAAAAAASPSPAGRPPIEGFAPVDDDEGRGGAAAAGAASNDAQEDERDEEYEEEDDDAAGDADAAAAAAAAAVAAAVAAADAGGAPQPAAGPRPALGGLAAGAAAAGEWAHRPRRELNLSRTFGGMQDDDQAAVLAELGACATLPCLISVHDKLAGRTRFNLPHFFLVGWQQCGTTAVGSHLRRHPEVMPPPRREPHFFTACVSDPGGRRCRAATDADYLRRFLRLENATAGGLAHATYDASADYAAKGEDLALTLYRLFPWVRIVLVLREPIARAASLTRVRAEEQSGGRGCEAGQELYDCLQPLLDPGPRSWLYARPLEGWLRTFPPDQVHVVQYEELEDSPQEVLRRLKVFLGLDPARPRAALGDLREGEGGHPGAGSTMRREQYRALARAALEDGEAVAALLTQYGVADGAAFLARWRGRWERAEARGCDAAGSCTIDTS